MVPKDSERLRVNDRDGILADVGDPQLGIVVTQGDHVTAFTGIDRGNRFPFDRIDHGNTAGCEIRGIQSTAVTAHGQVMG